MIRAGCAEVDARDTLFPRLDLLCPPSERPVDAYGPNGDAVAALVRRTAALDWLEIERIGSMWAYGIGHQKTGRGDALAMEVAIIAASAGRRDAIRAAFLDGQQAVLLACDPKVLSSDHRWDSDPYPYPEGHAMHAAGYLVAATVVEDRIVLDALEIARRPFVALDAGLPAGIFGPHHDAVASIVDAVPDLTREQARRIERTWSLEPRGDLATFGFPGPHEADRGIGGWMPRHKGRRHLAWIDLMERAGPSAQTERRFEWATASAIQRIRAGGAPRPTSDLHGAVMAAVAATIFADLAPAPLADDLTEAWRSRDRDVELASWWPQHQARAESELAREGRS